VWKTIKSISTVTGPRVFEFAEEHVSRNLTGDLPTSRQTEWLELTEFQDYRLSPRIRRIVMVIVGVPLLVLVVLAVWHLPVWDSGEEVPQFGVFSAPQTAAAGPEWAG
jgi:hypothetical protein